MRCACYFAQIDVLSTYICVSRAKTHCACKTKSVVVFITCNRQFALLHETHRLRLFQLHDDLKSIVIHERRCKLTPQLYNKGRNKGEGDASGVVQG